MRFRLQSLLGGNASGNVFWSGFEASVSGLLSCISAFAVARLIGPTELGFGAAVVAVHVLLWVAVNALFADALVQRAELSPNAADSALWASTLVGLFAGVVQLASGFGLAWALEDPRLPAMSAVLALALPLVGAAGPVQGMLTRGLAYRALAGRAVIGQGLGTAVGIGAALSGAGAWAVILQQICVSTAGALTLLMRAPWRPRLICRWNEVRALLRVGLPLTASTLVQHGRYRLFALLIGASAGPAALGQVHLAFRLVDTVRDLLMTALWRLLLPSMARFQHDPPALLATVDRSLARIGWVTFPLCAAMALTIVPLVSLLLGPVWTLSGTAAQPLVGLMAYGLLLCPIGIAGIARGAPKYALLTNLAALFVTLAGAALLEPATPMQAVIVWVTAQLLTTPYNLAMNARLLHAGMLRPLRAGLKPLGAAGIAALAGFAMPIGPDAAWLIVSRLAVAGLVFLLLVTIGNRPTGGRRRRAPGIAAILLLCAAPNASAQILQNYLPEGVPGYDTARGVTVLSRLRPLYDPPGVRAGTVVLHPLAEEQFGYDSNVLGTSAASGSTGIATRASVLANSDGSRDTLAAYASVEDIRAFALPQQDQTNWTGSLGGSTAIGHDRLTLGAAHLSLHQASTEIGALQTDTPVAYQVNDLRAGYTMNFSRLSVTPELNVTELTYDATSIQGFPAPQAYRNRIVTLGGATLRYELAPGSNAVVVLRAVDTDYTAPQVGQPTHNSVGYVVLAGIDHDYDGVWRARLLLGWEVRDFAAAQYATHSAPIIEAGLIWTPSGLTTVTGTITRSIEDAAQEGTAGYTYSLARLRLDHEYLRNFLLRTGASVQRAVYTSGGTQTGATVSAGATWLINRNLRLSADYAFTAQQGTPGTQPIASNYDRNLVTVSLRFAL